MTATQDTIKDKSLLQRMFWDAWTLAAGRSPTLADIHSPAVKTAIEEFVSKYLPEIKRIRNTKRTE